MNRKIWLLMLILLLIPVKAGAIQEQGSIRLTMRCGGGPVSGGALTVYDVSRLDVTKTPEELANYAQKHSLPGTSVTVDADGVAVCSDLEPGVYLVVQWETAPGYLPMEPFLFTVPMQFDGRYLYDITASPKLSLEPEETLPQTGQLKWPVWVLGGMGMMLFGTGLLIGKRE